MLPPTSNLSWRGFGFVGAAMSISLSRCLQPLTYWLFMFVHRKAHKPTWPGLNRDFLQGARVRAFLAQALPLIGTLIFQSVATQSTTLLIAQLGTLAVASSSAVAASTQVVSAGLTAAFTAVAAVRVGFHLGRNDVRAAQAATLLVSAGSVVSSLLGVAVCTPLSHEVVSLVTDDAATLPVAATLVGAGMVGAGLSQLISIGTSGVLGGQGRTLVSTVLSFGFELPLTLARARAWRPSPAPSPARPASGRHPSLSRVRAHTLPPSQRGRRRWPSPFTHSSCAAGTGCS